MPDVNIFQAVCVGLAYARQLCLRGKWKWSEIGLQCGAGEVRSPGSSWSSHFCRGKVLAGLITAARPVCPHPLHKCSASSQVQALHRLFMVGLNSVNRTKIKGLI